VDVNSFREKLYLASRLFAAASNPTEPRIVKSPDPFQFGKIGEKSYKLPDIMVLCTIPYFNSAHLPSSYLDHKTSGWDFPKLSKILFESGDQSISDTRSTTHLETSISVGQFRAVKWLTELEIHTESAPISGTENVTGVTGKLNYSVGQTPVRPRTIYTPLPRIIPTTIAYLPATGDAREELISLNATNNGEITFVVYLEFRVGEDSNEAQWNLTKRCAPYAWTKLYFQIKGGKSHPTALMYRIKFFT
jgi:hypothetical protein